MEITISNGAYEPLFNAGSYYTTVKDMSQFGLYSVAVNSRCRDPRYGLPDALIAWGFVRNKDDIPMMSETLLAACELIHSNFNQGE
jgi:hypothetical protein